MTPSNGDAQDSHNYRVYLLRLWRERNGPWHASLQSADAVTPHRFADMEALIAFLRELLVPVTLSASAAPAQHEPEADGAQVA